MRTGMRGRNARYATPTHREVVDFKHLRFPGPLWRPRHAAACRHVTVPELSKAFPNPGRRIWTTAVRPTLPLGPCSRPRLDARPDGHGGVAGSHPSLGKEAASHRLWPRGPRVADTVPGVQPQIPRVLAWGAPPHTNVGKRRVAGARPALAASHTSMRQWMRV